jgi:hypothetical protein
MDVARRWIHDCSEGHPECNEDKVFEVPTRLLYTGEDQCRVVSTAGWQSGCRYTTLSHR